MRILFLGACVGALFVMPVIAQDLNTQLSDVNAQASQQDIANFRRQMEEELRKQQEYVNRLGASMSDTSIAPAFINKVELGNAMIQLDVKRTLVANFWNSETLASTVLRSVLLQTLQKTMITEGDLAYLQTVADLEKAKMQAARTEARTPRPTSPAPTPAQAPTPASTPAQGQSQGAQVF